MSNNSLSFQKILIGMVFIPVLVLLYFLIINITEKTHIASEMEDVDQLVRFTLRASKLIHNLQIERGVSVGFIGNSGSEFSGPLSKQRTDTDRHISLLGSSVQGRIFAENGKFQQDYKNTLESLAQLEDIRQQITTQKIAVDNIFDYYSNLNASLIALVSTLNHSMSNTEAKHLMHGYLSLVNMKETAGIKRAVLANIFDQNRFRPELIKKFIYITRQQEYHLSSFKQLANNETLELYNIKMQNPSVHEADRMANIVSENTKSGNFDITPVDWFKAQSEKINLLQEVEIHFLDSLVTWEQNSYQSAKKEKIISIIIFLCAIGLLAGMAIVLNRNILANRDIRKLRETEQLLRDSEQQLNSILNNSPAVIYVKDTSSHYLLVNQRYEELFNIKNEDIKGKSDYDIFPSDVADSLRLNDLAVLNSRKAISTEEIIPQKDGNHFYISVKFCLYDNHKKPYAVCGISTDITDLKNAEHELHDYRNHLEELVKQRSSELVESESRFRQMADQAPALIWMSDIENKGIWYNRRWLEYTGRTLEQELGFGWIEGMHQDDRDRCARFCQTAFDRKQQFDMEFRLRKADGSYGWIADTGIPRFNENNQFLGYIGYCWDVTDRVNARQQIEENQQFLNMILEHLPVALFCKDTANDFRFTLWNKKSEDLFGIPCEQVIGRNDYDFFPREQADFFRQKDIEVINANTPVDISEETIDSKNHGRLLLHTVKAIVPDINNNNRYLLGISEDITARKKSELDLLHAKQEAEAANLAKSEFLARMSHELRTPMNAILGFGQLIQMDTDNLSAEQEVGINHIMDAGQHLLQLINEVLDITRVDSGETQFNLAAIDLNDALAGAISLVKPLADKTGITIELNDMANCILMTDIQRLKQVLVNLISNAIKYNNIGGKIVISCSSVPASTTDNTPKMAHISIADTGTGIQETDFQKIFEPFQRLKHANHNIEGTGIGLVITKKLVEHMGGKIGFTSEYGKGSTFWFELPMTGILPAKNNNKSVSLPVTEKKFSGKSILYIEDNPTNMMLVTHIINRSTNCTMLSSTSAEDGITTAQSEQPDLILMDISLPGMDGFQALKILQSDTSTSHIPVIAVSANAMPEQVARGKSAGFYDYLTKPVEMKKLLGVIENVFSKPDI